MKLDSAPGDSPRTRTLPVTGQLRLLDLARSPGHRPLWTSDPASADAPEAFAFELPRPGFPSPLGFWLTESAESSRAADPFLIRFAPPGTTRPSSESGEAVPARPEQTVRLRPPHTGGGELVLTLAPDGARVACSDSCWLALSEPVLLAIAQYRRFLLLDGELGRLLEEARGDLARATTPGLARLQGRRLTENARAVGELLLDLPRFEGPLSDPLPYCSTELAAQTYLSLAEKLRLEGWSERIDQRAEAVEAAYASLTERLSASRSFFWEVGLEVLIVLILLGELGLHLWELFGPE